MASSILCIGTTPALQRVMVFPRVSIGEVNRARQTREGIAGKSINVAKVLHALGGRPHALSFVGGPGGEAVRRELAARKISSDLIELPTPVRLCVTVIDEASGQVTELVEESRPVEAGMFEQFLRRVQRRLPGCRAAVMSGTIASGGPADLYARCVHVAREAGALAVVDATGKALELALEARPDVVKPNRNELATTVGTPLPDEPSVWAAMRELGQRGAARVVVTSGKKPVQAWDGSRAWRITVPEVKAINPIGSGDAFTAGLTLHLIRGDDLGEACRWGTAAGAANALTPLAGELDRAEVDRLARDIKVEPVSLPHA